MRCRFGTQEVMATLAAPPGGFIDSYNHTHMACQSPGAPTPMPQDVPIEVSLNGESWSSSGMVFSYYRDPRLVGVSPSRGSAAKPQVVTLTRSAASDSGRWGPRDDAGERRCRFESIVQPDGKRQVPFVKEVEATVADDTELLCITPEVSFVAPVRIDVTLNGQQFSKGGPTFTYEDNWHSPAYSGYAPPGIYNMASALVGSKLYLFGGETMESIVEQTVYGTGEMWALHLDVMSDFYPSESAYDLAWQKLSISMGGEAPGGRTQPSLVAWGSTLVLFGGHSGLLNQHNATYDYSTTRNVWRQVTVSGGPVAPRSAHTAVLCSLAQECSTSDGRPRMFVYAGLGLEPCTEAQPCLAHRGDLMALDLNAMAWSEVKVNAEQPRPPARKGHSANIINGSRMLVFGGSAWVPDPGSDNSFGYTTRHVNDLWRVDLSGENAHTWEPVHSIGDAPSPREGHTATLVKTRYLIIHGGYNHEAAFLNDTYVLDVGSDPMVWTRPTLTGAIPSGRSGHVAATIDDDEVVSVGGMSLPRFESDINILQIGVGNAMHYPGLSHQQEQP